MDVSSPPRVRGRHAPTAPPSDARRSSFWVELPVLVVIALLLALLVKTFLVQAFYIPSGSMEKTLHGCPGCAGDRVLVDKLVYRFHDPRRGDIVVFNGLDSFTPEVQVAAPSNPAVRVVHDVGQFFGLVPAGEQDFIKRVIGVPGDRVGCCDDKGRVTVNGVPLDETYLYPGDHPSDIPFHVVVPAGKLWVMGDHRSQSSDSRAHLGDPGGGMVPIDKVVGRAFAIVWPPSRAGLLRIPATFHQAALDRAPR